MSTFTIPGLHTVRTLAKHAGKTPAQLKKHIAQVERDNAALTAAAEDLTCAMSTAFLRGCQDSMRIAQLDTELAAAVAEVKRLQQAVVTQAAEHARLIAANRAWEARYANEHPVSVPAPKDLRADDDRPTIPNLDVTELRDQFRTPDGRVIHLSGAPFADPGQTTWGARNEQQEVTS